MSSLCINVIDIEVAHIGMRILVNSYGKDSVIEHLKVMGLNIGVGILFVLVHTSSKYFDYPSKFLLFAPMSNCKVIFSMKNSYAPLQCIS